MSTRCSSPALAISPTRQGQNSYLLDVTVLSDTPADPQRKESQMAFRKKLTRKGSKRSFRKGAMRVHKKNMKLGVLRGGIRL